MAVVDSLFQAGRLLLPEVPSPETTLPVETYPLAATLLMGLCVVLLIMLARPFLDLLPSLADSLFRARGSTALENSVRQSRDRSLIAMALLVPMALLTWRYRLYDPAFVRDLGPGVRLGAIAAVLAAYLLLRLLMYLWLKPRRRFDFYRLSHRTGYTYYILLMLLMLVTAAVLAIFGANDFIVRTFLYVEMALVYLVFLVSRGQILSLFCSHLLSFLYLCALELIPTVLLVVSAVVM